jgi:hypothetical protein
MLVRRISPLGCVTNSTDANPLKQCRDPYITCPMLRALAGIKRPLTPMVKVMEEKICMGLQGVNQKYQHRSKLTDVMTFVLTFDSTPALECSPASRLVQSQKSLRITNNEVGSTVDHGGYICQNYFSVDLDVIYLQLPENLKGTQCASIPPGVCAHRRNCYRGKECVQQRAFSNRSSSNIDSSRSSLRTSMGELA